MRPLADSELEIKFFLSPGVFQNATTLGIMTSSIMNLIATHRVMPSSIMTHSTINLIATLSIMPSSIVTYSIMDLIATPSINDIQHNDTQHNGLN